MIFSSRPIMVDGQLCREFGHVYIYVYTRPWRKLFRKETRKICAACDSIYRDITLAALGDHLES